MISFLRLLGKGNIFYFAVNFVKCPIEGLAFGKRQSVGVPQELMQVSGQWVHRVLSPKSYV